MRDTPSKADNVGDVLPAANFNALNKELENLITTAGITLDPDGGPDANLFMISEALATYASSAWHYADSGSANTYVLSRVASSTLKNVPAYYDGMAVSFEIGNTNSGASTINVATLGAKAVFWRGVAVTSGILTAGERVLAFFDTANDRFNVTLPGLIMAAISGHNKAIHDALGIDAGTLDGNLPSAFAPAAHTHTAPAFHVHKNTTDQVVSDATITIVTWSTEEFDTNSDFASNVFTPSVAGKYLISATIEAFDLAGGSPLFVYLYKNGSLYKIFTDRDVGAGGKSAVSISAVVAANGSTDNYDIRVQGTAVVTDITVEGDIDKTYFSGSLVSED